MKNRMCVINFREETTKKLCESVELKEDEMQMKNMLRDIVLTHLQLHSVLPSTV